MDSSAGSQHYRSITYAFIWMHFLVPHLHFFVYISACLRGIRTHFTQLNALWHHAGLSVKLQLCGIQYRCQTSLPFCSRNHISPRSSFHPLVSFSVSFSSLTHPFFFYHFPSLSPLIFPLILSLFLIFPKTGFAASSADRILFQCQMKIPGMSAILSRRCNKSGTLRVIWRRLTQIPLARGLQLKGCYVAGVPGLFRFIPHICGLQPSHVPVLSCSIFNVYLFEGFRVLRKPDKTHFCLDFRLS